MSDFNGFKIGLSVCSCLLIRPLYVIFKLSQWATFKVNNFFRIKYRRIRLCILFKTPLICIFCILPIWVFHNLYFLKMKLKINSKILLRVQRVNSRRFHANASPWIFAISIFLSIIFINSPDYTAPCVQNIKKMSPYSWYSPYREFRVIITLPRLSHMIWVFKIIPFAYIHPTYTMNLVAP